jgi:hypothetical protein
MYQGIRQQPEQKRSTVLTKMDIELIVPCLSLLLAASET